jgi:hypothetical protein
LNKIETNSTPLYSQKKINKKNGYIQQQDSAMGAASPFKQLQEHHRTPVGSGSREYFI